MSDIILECRGPDGWHTVERGELPIMSDHWGAELRVSELVENDSEQGGDADDA